MAPEKDKHQAFGKHKVSKKGGSKKTAMKSGTADLDEKQFKAPKCKKQNKSVAVRRKAVAAKKKVLSGSRSNRTRKIRTKPRFRRPITQVLLRKPKYTRRSMKMQQPFYRCERFDIIKYPLNSETAMRLIENHNIMVFIVDGRANKPKIKFALEKLYKIRVRRVNTLIRPDGQKKAYVKLPLDYDALDVANMIGLV